jgi:hypothetical protein
MDWKEIEIKDFTGIASANRNPRLNEARTCSNLDLREINGDLTSREGYTLKYEAPYIFNGILSGVETLSFANFYVPDVGGGREVTLLIQKGFINPLPNCAGIGFNSILMLIRPYWDGAQWVDNWQWLNETYITQIYALDATYADTISLKMGDFGRMNANALQRFTIINQTRGTVSHIISSDATVFTNVTMPRESSDWQAGDEIILMRNYVPLSFLQSMGASVTAKDVVFHKLLNDLRVGFGGQQGRLGLSVGYRNYKMNNQPGAGISPAARDNLESYAAINGIILNPYMPLSETNWLEVTANGMAYGGLTAGTWRYYLTAILDDFNEFPVKEGSIEIVADGQGIDLFISVNPGLCSTRLTKIGIYCAQGSGPFYKIRDVSLLAPNRVGFSGNGMLYPSPSQVIDMAAWEAKGAEMFSQLGYSPTTEFALSWDQAIVTGGKTFMVNPHMDKRYLNKIFFSPISGDGAFQYDVISPENYFDLENFDGNDLMGITLLPSMDFMAFKRNSVQRLDSGTGASTDIALGKGCISRESIVNFGNQIAWCGENDIYMTDGVNVVNISDGAIRDLYRALSAKDAVFAVREEKDGAYRWTTGPMPTGEPEGGYYAEEFLYTKRGWTELALSHYPEKYVVAKDGSVWFMSEGNIYATGGSVDHPNTGITFQWKSIRVDRNLMGPEIRNTHLIYVRRLWISYSFTSDQNPAFSLIIYLDGIPFKTMDFKAKGSLQTDYGELPVGASCRSFEIELIAYNTKTTFRLHSLGAVWAPLPVGRRG